MATHLSCKVDYNYNVFTYPIWSNQVGDHTHPTNKTTRDPWMCLNALKVKQSSNKTHEVNQCCMQHQTSTFIRKNFEQLKPWLNTDLDISTSNQNQREFHPNQHSFYKCKHVKKEVNNYNMFPVSPCYIIVRTLQRISILLSEWWNFNQNLKLHILCKKSAKWRTLILDH